MKETSAPFSKLYRASLRVVGFCWVLLGLPTGLFALLAEDDRFILGVLAISAIVGGFALIEFAEAIEQTCVRLARRLFQP